MRKNISRGWGWKRAECQGSDTRFGEVFKTFNSSWSLPKLQVLRNLEELGLTFYKRNMHVHEISSCRKTYSVIPACTGSHVTIPKVPLVSRGQLREQGTASRGGGRVLDYPLRAEMLAGGISPRGSDLHGLLVLSAVHPFIRREGREERNSIRLRWFSGVKRWNSLGKNCLRHSFSQRFFHFNVLLFYDRLFERQSKH